MIIVAGKYPIKFLQSGLKLYVCRDKVRLEYCYTMQAFPLSLQKIKGFEVERDR